MATATPDDIINFLIWKDSSGKTTVHIDDCSNFGNKRKTDCSCPKRLAYGTVDSLIGKLRSIFCNFGRTSDETLLPGSGNPAASLKVRNYLKAIREEQLRARTRPSQAEPLFVNDLSAISNVIFKLLSCDSNSKSQLFILARDQAFFKVQFFAGDRAGDLGLIKTAEILSFPEKDALIFNHVLTKSLRDGSENVFALKRYKDPAVCPVVALEVYIKMCDYLKVNIRHGYLFRPLSPSGDILPGPFDSSAAQARLFSYTKKIPDAFKGRHPTLHGLRSGCAISLALSGIELREIMDHVGWKANATAHHYIKLRQVLACGGASDILSRLPSDLTDNYRHRNDLFGFTQAF